jgi:hypothetical protein
MTTRTTTFGRLLDWTGVKSVKKDAWSVIKVERMLDELGITGYEFVYQAKAVRLKNPADLMKIMLHTVPSEVSHDYNLILGRINEDLKLKVGSWQFEAKA